MKTGCLSREDQQQITKLIRSANEAEKRLREQARVINAERTRNLAFIRSAAKMASEKQES